MPPFNIEGSSLANRVRWTMHVDEAREVADLLAQLEDPRADEMAFDLRRGVQQAVSRSGGR